MTLSEKSAYLKGLMDGLKLSDETSEGKMITAIVDLLQEMTVAIGNLEENAIAVSDELDEIEEDLDAIEEYILDDEEDFDDDEDEDYDFDEECMYEVTCPKCGEVIPVDEDTILNESIDCPKCGEPLEFEFDEDEEF
ncbi:MAG: hypothetical protein LBM28_06055 [Oscillospiraceae bacterium]|jgi:formylmethanofuran dehydrogenase subunit E|nr:hypothetical protein [Oscillospiraceae bacterium]